MKIALINELMPSEGVRRLEIMGLTPIPLPPDRRLSPGVSRHPDTLVGRVGKNLITTAEYLEDSLSVFSDIREYLGDIRLHFTSDERDSLFPGDAKMNLLIMGKLAFGRLDSLSERVKEIVSESGLTLVGTRQGYPACTVLALSESAAITSDEGMARVLSSVGIRVTKIEQGDIYLPPHEYGFIGGASFVYNNKVYFFGDIKRHRSFPTIASAIEREGMSYSSLFDGELTDLGGILLLE